MGNRRISETAAGCYLSWVDRQSRGVCCRPQLNAIIMRFNQHGCAAMKQSRYAPMKSPRSCITGGSTIVQGNSLYETDCSAYLVLNDALFRILGALLAYASC